MRWKETTLDTNKQSVSSQIAAMNAATAQVVTMAGENKFIYIYIFFNLLKFFKFMNLWYSLGTSDEVDHTAVGAAITTITSNLPEMTRGVRMIAALMDDDNSGDRLLDAARKLCSAFTDLLKAAEPDNKEVNNLLFYWWCPGHKT